MDVFPWMCSLSLWENGWANSGTPNYHPPTLYRICQPPVVTCSLVLPSLPFYSNGYESATNKVTF